MTEIVPDWQDRRRAFGAPDNSLAQVSARRSKVSLDVTRYERANSMVVVVRDREEAKLQALNGSQFPMPRLA
jgi:chorismate mutase